MKDAELLFNFSKLQQITVNGIKVCEETCAVLSGAVFR